jgi:predicted CxxxxCH...CXXCH cytochrome family protein
MYTLSLAAAVLASGCGGPVEAIDGLARSGAALTQDDACLDGDPACTPTGAHAKHAAFDCKVCHKVGGRLSFDRNGPAYAAGKPAPTFNATAKTCSNVACHGVPAGTFTYFFPGGDGEPEQKTVAYGGTTAAATPAWYSTGASCGACHADAATGSAVPTPPLGVWHTGLHGSGAAMNTCSFCHPDATGTATTAALSTATNCGTAAPYTGTGTKPCASLHADGTVQVRATYTSACFGCH